MLVTPVAAALVGAGCGRQGAAPRPAPVFPYTLLDGGVRNSQALRGQVVLINFWATTCAVCVKEMPALVATHQRFQPLGLQMLAVAVRHDPPALVADFARRQALPFGVVIDNTGAIADGFGDVRGTPTTYVVNRAGLVAQRMEGAPHFKRLHQLIEQLLAQGSGRTKT